MAGCLKKDPKKSNKHFLLFKLKTYKVFAGLNNNNIVIWDVDQNKVNLTLTGHTDQVRSLKLLNDGVTLASGSHDMQIKLWNITKGTLIRTLTGHTDFVRCVRQLNNGYLISASFDFSIKVWDLNSGANLQTLANAHNGTNVAYVEPLSDGNFASAGYDKLIKIWSTSASTYVVVQTLSGHTSSVWCLKQLSDGTLASGAYDQTVRVWNMTSGAQLNSFSPLNGNIYSVEQVSSSGPIILAIGGVSTKVAFLNLQSSQKSLVTPAGSQTAYRALLFYNSTLMYGGTMESATISLLNPRNFQIGLAYSLTSTSSDYVICLEKSSSVFLYINITIIITYIYIFITN